MKIKFKRISTFSKVILFLLVLLIVSPLYAGVKEVLKTDALGAMVFLSEEKAILTERKNGNLLLILFANNKASIVKRQPLNLNLVTEGQGAIFDMILHPQFTTNKWVYLSYAEHTSDGNSRLTIARGLWEDDTLKQIETIYTAPSHSDTKHYGGALAFDINTNHLYATLGERNNRKWAQDLSSSLGSIIRLNDDGSIPITNPWIDKKNVAEEIYAYGNRNPQGLYYDNKKNQLWSTEHGPKGGDELNLIKAGANYGWPIVCQGTEYTGEVIGVKSLNGVEDGIYTWMISLALSGITMYSGTVFPNLEGHLLVASLKTGELFAMNTSSNVLTPVNLINNEVGRIRNLAVSPAGNIYILSDKANLYKLEK